MTAFFKKHSTLILISLLLTLLILSWMVPSERLFLGITFVLFSFLVGSAAILAKHQEAYQEGRVTRSVFIRHAMLEIGDTLTIMLLAGLLGRYVAQIATRPIADELLRVIAGLVVAMFVGIGVGVLAKKTLGQILNRRGMELDPSQGRLQ